MSRTTRGLLKLRRAISRGEKWLYRKGMLSTKNFVLPEFLVIGMRKSGTTWLYENLLRHPSIFLVSGQRHKGLEYFDHHFEESVRSYLERFHPGIGKIRGEVSASYSVMALNRIEFLHAVLPDIKLVLLLRHPVDRAWSQAYMQLVRESSRPREEIGESEFFDYFNNSWFIKQNNYPRILNNWFSVFEPEQIHIGFFESIAKSPQTLLSRVLEHIGANVPKDWADFPFNSIIVPPSGDAFKDKNCDPSRGVIVPEHTSSERYMPASIRYFLCNRYSNDLQVLKDEFHLPVEHWISSCTSEDAASFNAQSRTA